MIETRSLGITVICVCAALLACKKSSGGDSAESSGPPIFQKPIADLTKEEIAIIGQELDAGHVAVVVTCDDFEIPLVTEYMTSSGGKVTTYAVPEAALAEAAQSPEVMAAVTEG